MLSHIRVVDFCSGVSQFAGHLLARLGAEVIAVEPPTGVATRHMGPYANNTPDPNRSLTHWAYNCGKKSVILDIEVQRDKEKFCDLLRGSDILLEDCHPEYLASLGLSIKELSQINPKLIHASITPYGSNGPRSHWLGTCLLYTSDAADE